MNEDDQGLYNFTKIRCDHYTILIFFVLLCAIIALVTRIFEQGEPSREDKPECARLPVDEDGNEIVSFIKLKNPFVVFINALFSNYRNLEELRKLKLYLQMVLNLVKMLNLM